MKVQDERENKSLTNAGLSSRKTSARSSFRAEVVVGTATIHSIRSNMQMKVSLKSGFTLVEIMIVVAIIGLLAAIAIPNLVTARKKAQRQACISSLKAIEGAKANWALDYKKGDNDVPGDGDLFWTAIHRSQTNLPGQWHLQYWLRSGEADLQRRGTYSLVGQGRVVNRQINLRKLHSRSSSSVRSPGGVKPKNRAEDRS